MINAGFRNIIKTFRKPLGTVSIKCLPDTGTEKSINNTTMGWYNPLLAIYMITEWFRLNRYQALFRLILDFTSIYIIGDDNKIVWRLAMNIHFWFAWYDNCLITKHTNFILMRWYKMDHISTFSFKFHEFKWTKYLAIYLDLIFKGPVSRTSC